jgi:hypothetical protein
VAGESVDRAGQLEAMVRDEHQRQGASNVTVRNIITSMRLISDVNWPDFLRMSHWWMPSCVRHKLSVKCEQWRHFACMDFAEICIAAQSKNWREVRSIRSWKLRVR